MMRCICLYLSGLAVAALLCARSTDTHAAPADSLVGWWSARLDFGPSIRGELAIDRHGGHWRARLSGQQVTVPFAGDSLTFTFPKGRGRFRGMLAANRKTIDGFWIQPAGNDEEVAGGRVYGQMYATPVTLERRGSSPIEWRARVEPLNQTFTLHLQIFRGPLGNRIAAFRNPEMNSIGGSTQFHARTQGGAVVFVIRPDSLAPEIRLEGSINPSLDRLRVYWPDLGREIELKRSDTAPPGALPRAPGDTNYVYRRPIDGGDGWTTAHAGEAGMDGAVLAKLVNRLLRTNPSARRPTLMHSLLVARRGKLVLEEYFFGHERDDVHDSRSAGKTFGAVMLGATMLGNARISPDTKITELLVARAPFANPDPRKDAITLAHLMTHSAGLACNDNDDASPGNEDTMQRQTAQPDWWKYTLDLPMAHEPGVRYAYCSANTNLVGAALTTATGTWLPALFERTVARPLEFGRWHWNLIPNGEGYLGGGARLRPRDLLKIGQMYLDGGVWKGRRIVDSSWVRISTAPHMEISPATTGMDSVEFGNNYIRAMEGYLWHLGELQGEKRTYRAYMASGNGGQLLVVVPELEMVVVFTGGNYRQGGIWLRWVSQVIPHEIIPSIRE